jgi:hypothetical protein
MITAVQHRKNTFTNCGVRNATKLADLPTVRRKCGRRSEKLNNIQRKKKRERENYAYKMVTMK